MISEHRTQRNAVLTAVAVLGICLPGAVRADIIDLTGGGRIEGKVVPSEDTDKSTFVIDLATGGRVTVPRSQVTRVDTTSDAEAEYEKLTRSAPDTVESHEKIAEWCRQHKLQREYQQHLERILELSPNHAEARAALGFHQKDGQWMNRDDVMAARGLVMYEGRYVTPQQVEIMKQQKESRVTQADWTNKIEQLRHWLTGRRQDKAAQARADIAAINDPAAGEAVVAVLRHENAPDLKRLWLEVAARLNSRAAVDALVDFSLNDPDDDIRHQCVEYLIKSGRPGVSAPYVRALSNKDNVIVNRAGAALGQIKDRDSLGPLIEALITKH
ncbi:MAG TPA: HEAT repeat domain-containing protein, partial [Lacipirellulaceae bacterium]|nr:HEAT repeat domain-containing protein [Lacipirellulaceae bacterium]